METAPPTVKQIQQHLAMGNVDLAVSLAGRLLAVEPENGFALSFLSSRAMETGRLEEAIAFSRRATRAYPGQPVLWQNLGICQHRSGHHQAALEAHIAAVRADPTRALSYLYLAQSLEQVGQPDQAALAVSRAYQTDGNLENLSRNPSAAPILREICAEAERIIRVGRHRGHQQAVRSACGSDAPSDRFRAFLEGYDHLAPVEYQDPLQRPNYQYVPDLEAAPWWESQRFEWVGRLEAGYDDIGRELAGVLEEGGGTEPYVGEIYDQAPQSWQKLKFSQDWSSFHLFKAGERVEENCARCPRTVEVLDSLPLATAKGHAPEAFFSILAPGTHIPPHVGLANTKLTVHLPLIVPADCAIRVGEKTRAWEPGRVMIFDDSYVHEAWNRSNETRAVLITEVWNPDLDAAEIDGLAAVIGWDTDFFERARTFEPGPSISAQ